MNCRPFGTVDGREVKEIILDNGELSCSVLTYGCILRTLNVPNRDGGRTDVVLGYDSIDQYVKLSGRMGAVIGRYANRIRDGRFRLGGETVQLSVNRPPNHLHGGFSGFDKKMWDVLDSSEDSVTLGYRSPDGEEGYPGDLDVRITYSLVDSSVEIRYEAVSDRDTVCSLTNHSYFNLSGKDDIGDHTVRIKADRYTPSGDDGIPTGEISDVSGPVDLRECTKMDSHTPYDLNYILNGGEDCAECCSGSTGIVMRVSTDMPALQFYTGDGLKDTEGKNGSRISKRSGLCFETQYPPDAPNNPTFGPCLLKKGDVYDQRTTFIFEIRQSN